ncbi:MAG: flagellin FliC [Candidatus Hydrogenedentes bacterium]|nr:flagellin FliC [Candidatus Hydrogenedentota bacterium]
MGLRINNNLPALDATRQTNRTSGLLAQQLERLASGRRINRASDDAAGLAIAERFATRVRQGQAELNNLQTGVNLAQTADGGLQVQQDALGRLRELAVQGANGTLSDDQRAAINSEAQQLIEQIGGIAEDTEFNGVSLLNGSQSNVSLGVEGGIQVNLNSSTADDLGVSNLDISSQDGAAAALSSIDSALARVDQSRSSLGAQQNRFESAIQQRETNVANAQDAESRIRDLDFARASVERTRNELLLQAGVFGTVQGNVSAQSALRVLGR